MSMDRDFPMSGTQAKALVVGLVVMAAFGAALFGGAIPGLKPNSFVPNKLVLNGEPYYFTTFLLNTPFFPVNHTSPQSTSFHNVTFWLWLTNWFSSSGGILRGNGTEPNGSVYSFVLGNSIVPRVNTTLFVSPDHLFAVYFQGGLLGGYWTRLMVHV